MREAMSAIILEVIDEYLNGKLSVKQLMRWWAMSLSHIVQSSDSSGALLMGQLFVMLAEFDEGAFSEAVLRGRLARLYERSTGMALHTRTARAIDQVC